MKTKLSALGTIILVVFSNACLCWQIYIRAEIERLKKLLEGKDLELFTVQQNNQQLLKKYGAEISYLLNAQKESQVS